MPEDGAEYTDGVQREEPPFDCPFDGCEWTSERDTEVGSELQRSRFSHEHEAERHYAQEHAGKVRIRVTLEREQQLGPRDPHDIADRAHDRIAERDDLRGWDVAYAVAEVVEDSDPHPESDPDE